MNAFFASLLPQVQGAVVGALLTFLVGVVMFVLNWIRVARAERASHERAKELEDLKHERDDWVEFRQAITELVTVTNAWFSRGRSILPQYESRARKGGSVVPISESEQHFVALGEKLDELLLRADVLAPHDGNFELVDRAIQRRNEFQAINGMDYYGKHGYFEPAGLAGDLRLAVLELRNVERGLPRKTKDGEPLDPAAVRTARFVGTEVLGRLED